MILGFVFKYSKSANAPCDIYIVLGLLVLEGKLLICFNYHGCCTYESLVNVITGICVNLTVYHFCWLVIGIMINPTWGLSILLIVYFFKIALTYTFYYANCGILSILSCVSLLFVAFVRLLY